MTLEVGLEEQLWPLVDNFRSAHETAGLAVAVRRGDEVVSRGFGVRDARTGAPVTPETMFHLASVSKPFVATAVVSVATATDDRPAALDLDAPITEPVPEFTLADGRASEVTARTLLSHTSGLPDVSDYGWHDPQLGDDALSAFASGLSHWRLQSEPGAVFRYSNAGYELLGLALSRVCGTTFEAAVRDIVLAPLGMTTSTFLRSQVPAARAASPHVGMPLQVPEGAYPYTRRHAPSSTLHSNLIEMCRWIDAHLAPDPLTSPSDADVRSVRLSQALVDKLWRPVVSIGEPPWEEAMAMGWAAGRYRGERVLSHSGADPGFGSRLVIVPERRTGVVVLANSNTVSTGAIALAALDVALADAPSETQQADDGITMLRDLRPPVVGPVAEELVASGPTAAVATFRRLAEADPCHVDLDEDGFVDAVWGAIELHRTLLVWPLLRVWTEIRPDSSTAWTMTGWAHQVDGDLESARQDLRRALNLDPDNDEAALILGDLPTAAP